MEILRKFFGRVQTAGPEYSNITNLNCNFLQNLSVGLMLACLLIKEKHSKSGVSLAGVELLQRIPIGLLKDIFFRKRTEHTI